MHDCARSSRECAMLRARSRAIGPSTASSGRSPTPPKLPGSSHPLARVKYATLEWVDWFNHRRLLEPIGNVPPAELELAYYRQQDELALAA